MAAAQSFSESRRHEAPVSVPAPAPEPAPVEARPDPAAFASAIEESLSQPAPEPQMMASEPAPTMTDDVTIRPLPPRPVFNEPVQEAAPAAHEAPESQHFIPPAPERTALRAPRMPRIDELPLPAQNQIRQSRGEAVEDHGAKRTSLLQRLAAVGLGRREDEADKNEPHLQQHAMPSAPMAAPAADYARRAPAAAPAPRPVQGSLDAHGRAPATHRAMEDDLEIPAFLRRQAN